MDPTQPPLNIAPQVAGGSPYAAPNSPYQSPSFISLISALKAGTQGTASATQQQPAGGAGANAPAGQSNTPNYSQFGQQMGAGFGNLINALGGSSPSFGGGNLMSGDAWGGSAAMPLQGLSAADYG